MKLRARLQSHRRSAWEGSWLVAATKKAILAFALAGVAVAYSGCVSVHDDRHHHRDWDHDDHWDHDHWDHDHDHWDHD